MSVWIVVAIAAAGLCTQLIGPVMWTLTAPRDVPFETRVVMCRQATENARELIDAISRYEEEVGHFPEDLEQLVPDYLPTIPETGFRYWKTFQYYMFPNVHREAVFWYKLGPADSRIFDEQSRSAIGSPEDALLVFTHRDGQIIECRPVRLGTTENVLPFMAERWQNEPDSRKEMIESFLKDDLGAAREITLQFDVDV